MFYPPSPAHLAVLLSLFHTTSSSESRFYHSHVTLHAAPSLIILHELSSYFLPQVDSQPTSHTWTLASYLTLVMRTFSLVAQWTSQVESPTMVALFDSQIDRLKLPVLKFPTAPYDRLRAQEKSMRTEEVASFLNKYFEWLASAECEDMQTQSDPQEESSSKRMRLRFTRHGSQNVSVTWSWIERRFKEPDSGQLCTEFVDLQQRDM
ncbi:hypothetical protein D9758_001234 [Tetrapyrgos nigripes]|uniref:Uncharacterized protein n=1 Tax=Tetrapyrgos nigripes TaxID=182062 RepID=A0A8H5GRF1_9AGAR|nr:hypothetical protein D9758_001234 [Tetrapyrgos nigripes]